MILEPGSFDVKQYRKAIPEHVKREALRLWLLPRVAHEGGDLAAVSGLLMTPAKDWRFDHRPALCDRPYDTNAGDFIPPQLDPSKIEPLQHKVHDQRTFGRKPDAAVTVTTRGSDVGERARSSDIRATQAVHEARIAIKRGDQKGADEILANARFKKKHTRPKSKIPQRKDPWGTQKRTMGMGAKKHERGERRDSTSPGAQQRRRSFGRS